LHRRTFVLSTATVLALAPHAAGAQSAPVGLSDAIARLFTPPAVSAAWFSPLFLAAIPIEHVQTIVNGIVSTLGPYSAIVPNGARFTLHFARGTIQGEGALDPSGALTGLLFSRMQSQAVLDRLTALMTEPDVPADWFSARFLAAVPIERGRAIVASVKAQDGDFVRVTPAPDGSYDIALTKGRIRALAFLNSDGKIEGLIFQPETN
jgi:hypothetical protein